MLTVMIKWNDQQKKIKFILSLFIAFSLIISVGAACLRPQIVYASVAGTIAGYILTLFASFNTAITNTEVVTAINNTFGQMSMVEADAALIDQGIASIAASTGFDMASIFANTAEEAAQVIASLPAGSITEEAIAATAGVNIAAGAGACAASATGSVLPVIGGLVIPAAGAVALGVAGGVLINHIRERIVNFVKGGYSLDTPKYVMNRIPDGCSYKSRQLSNGRMQYFLYPLESRICTYQNRYVCVKNYGPAFRIQVRNDNGTGMTFDPMYQGDKSTFDINANSDFFGTYMFGGPNFSNQTEAYNYLDGFDSGLKKPNVSPDIIGSLGNQKGEYDATDGQYKLPGIRPAYDYGSNVVNYIPPSDYNDFINDANNNTDIGDTEQDPQGDLFDSFINPYIAPVDDPSIPENPDQPEIPDREPTVPYPDPEEYPDAIPEVNPVPDTDIAPTAIPYPELPEPTDTEITETNDKITPFDLKNKFPFCLPFDIHKALLKLKGAREAPYFIWTIPFGDAGEQTVTVDLRAWDEVASILRFLELLLFIVGLAVVTRNLIGGT